MSIIRSAAAVVTIIKDGETRTLSPVDVSIKQEPSKPLAWSVGIKDPEGKYSPDNPDSGWAEWLTPAFEGVFYTASNWTPSENWDDTTDPDLADWLNANKTPTLTQSHYVNISIYTESGEMNFGNLTIMKSAYTREPGNGYHLTISGEDFSRVLYRTNQTKETVQYKNAKEIIGGILKNFGFSDYELNFPDFPVNQFDFQADSPINRIQTLLNEVGALWRVQGKRFITWIPAVKSQAEWTYRDSEVLRHLNSDADTIDLYNYIKVGRVTKNATLAWGGDGTLEKDTSTGYENIFKRANNNGNFSGVFRNCSFRILEETGCKIQNIFFWKDGEPITGTIGSDEGGTAATEADGISFAVLPLSPLEYTSTSVSPYWKAEVRGTPEAMAASGIDADAKHRWYDANSINTYGLLPAPSIESNFTASDTIAEMKCKAFLRQNGRTKKTANFETPINPYLSLDDTIYLDERVTYFSGYFNPDSIETKVNADGKGSQTLQVCKYEY